MPFFKSWRRERSNESSFCKYSKKSSIIVTHDGGLNILPFNSGGIYYYDYQKGLFPINSHNFAFGQIYDLGLLRERIVFNLRGYFSTN